MTGPGTIDNRKMEELEDQSNEQSLVTQELDQPECSVKEPNFEAKIRGLEELIKNLGEQKNEIIHKLDDLTFERHKANPWEYLYHQDQEKFIKYSMANRRQEVDIFELVLEKLSNNNFNRPTKSCSPSNEDVHKQKFHFWVRHGTRSLAEENKLFGRTKTSQLKEKQLCDPSDWLHRRMRNHRQRPEDRAREIKHNEWNRKESVAEAILQGKIRSSLVSSIRRDIRGHIKVNKDEFEELRKEVVKARDCIACLEREMKAKDKQICALTKQLDSISRRKERAQRSVSELRKELV